MSSFLEKLAKAVEDLAGTHEVPVTVVLDDAGYLDRECPNLACQRRFKVLFADDSKFGDAGWCVYCGHTERNAGFATQAQSDHASAVVLEYADQQLHNAMKEAARGTPKTTTYGGKHASVTITETTEVPERASREIAPPEAWAVMRVEATCARCQCRFAGLGACYFCPACGHRSAELTFDQTLRRVRDALSKREALETAIGADYAADVLSKMVESDVQALVTAFETFAKDSFPRLAPGAPPPRRNVFQGLVSGSELWAQHGGRRFETILSTADLVELGRYSQQRHVLAHNNGVVDASYLAATNDNRYAVGQRLSIRADDVLRLGELVEKLVIGLRADLPK